MSRMEVVLGVGVIAVVVWFMRRSESKPQAPTKKSVRSQSIPPRPPPRERSLDELVQEQERLINIEAERMLRELDQHLETPEPRREPSRVVDKGPEHRPPKPTAETTTAWSSEVSQLEVAGEWYRAESLRRLLRKHGELSENGYEIRLPATLVPDPSNPHDGNAVAVFVDRLHVGYMERPDARRYHSNITQLGQSLQVPSRQWVRVFRGETWARVTLVIPPPDGLVCPNPIDGAAYLPVGGTVQVTREDDYLDSLRPMLAKYGPTVVAATLEKQVEVRPRSKVDVIAVLIDGEQVGILSPTQKANFAPLVERAVELGTPLACRARIRGNALKVDVTLFAPKAHEMTDEELGLLLG